MTRSSNRICLVIPYYEAGGDLTESLSTVELGADDLIIVVDDGSRHRPARQFLPPSAGPTAVQLIELERNSGITVALRTGISRAPKEYGLIARLDCGDSCLPDRFDKQRRLLRDHPEIVLAGSWVDFVSPDGSFLYRLEQPTGAAGIRRRMRVNCAIIHPSAVFRREAYDAVGGYPTDFPAAEDYALFMLLLGQGEAANIPEALVRCRTGDGGISETKRRVQLASRRRVLLAHFDWHPASVYGILRATAQMVTPRSWSTAAHRVRRRITGH